MKLLIFISVLALTQAQVLIDSVSRKPWTGPIADHRIGVQPGDTPEVAAAKSQHLKAFQDALAALPELTSAENDEYDEQDADEEVNNVPSYIQPRFLNVQTQPKMEARTPPIQPVFKYVQNRQHPAEVQTIRAVPTVLAEDIPRSPIGEVPEVHNARVAHLKAFQKARAELQSLSDKNL